MRKILYVRLSLLLFAVICFAWVPACSSSKSVQKAKQETVASSAAHIAPGPDGVKAKLGEPTVVSKTAEGHILWVYRPAWKIWPDDKGTLYVEFVDGKAVKVFKKE